MIEITDMPAINAGLNGISALLLTAGYVCIRRGRVNAHVGCMAAAFLTSTIFLGCYLFYHYHVGHVRFQGSGLVRTAYLAILFSHIVLAVAVVPLAVVTLYQAVRWQVVRHRRVARWTLPIWLYVSVTGVVIYWMLYGLGQG